MSIGTTGGFFAVDPLYLSDGIDPRAPFLVIEDAEGFTIVTGLEGRCSWSESKHWKDLEEVVVELLKLVSRGIEMN